MREKFFKKDLPRERSAESLQIRFDPIIACFSNRGKTRDIYVSTIYIHQNQTFYFFFQFQKLTFLRIRQS